MLQIHTYTHAAGRTKPPYAKVRIPSDPPGQYTDDMGAGSSSPYTVQQQFLVDRLGLQVFWPNSTPTLSKFDRMIGTASTTIAPSWP